MKTMLALTVVAATLVAACTPTQNHAIVAADGRLYQRIVCRAETPAKCLTRASEVCGHYTVTEPLHRRPPGESYLLEMVVECHLPTVAGPTASAKAPPSAELPLGPPPPSPVQAQ